MSNYGNYNNEYGASPNTFIDEIRELIAAIDMYPGEDPKQAIRVIDAIVNPLTVPNNDGNSQFDDFITTHITDVREKVDDEWPVQRRNIHNNDGNIDEDIHDDQQKKVGRCAGLLPYVYAYLTGKDAVLELFIDYMGDTEVVFSEKDEYGYTFADYALESKDFERYFQIIEAGGKLNYYKSMDTTINNEESNSNRNANESDLHFVKYTNNNYKKILKKYANKYSKGDPIAGFHGNVIHPLAPSLAPARSRKHINSNEPLYGHTTFRSRRHGPMKHIVMPVESKSIKDWMESQTMYVNSSHRIKYILASYKKIGHTLVNMYLRNILFDDSRILNKTAKRLINESRGRFDPVPFLYQISEHYDRIVDIYKKMVLHKKIPAYLTDIPSRNAIKIDGNPDIRLISRLYYKYKDVFDSKEILEALLRFYANDVNKIIRESPKLPDSIIVYRGAEQEFELPEGKTEYTTKSFLSTSLNPTSAIGFAQELHPTLFCCLYEIKIPKSVPILYIPSLPELQPEYEIILPLYIRMRGSEKMLLKRMYDYEDRVLVREMTAKGVHATLSATRRKRKSKSKSKKPLGGAGGPPRSRRNSSS